MPSAAAFRRSRWLPNAHLETIAAAYNRTPRVDYQREIIQTREHDEIALDYITGNAEAPLLVLLHGLEGCSQSRTLRLLASGFVSHGWTVAVPHFRSCGGHLNRLPRTYHAADADEVAWMIAYCRAYFAHSKIFVVGVSLGGSALIHHLIRGTHHSPAAVVSTPFDLPTCVQRLDSGINRHLYARHFLRSLRPKIQQKAHRFPDICDQKKLKKATTIGEFDALYTAPVHGFPSAQAYWQQASTATLLEQIPVPLLCINAQNDPLIPPHTLPQTSNPLVTHNRPKQGGHGAFIGTPRQWLFETVHEFFTQQADTHPAPVPQQQGAN